MQGFRPFLLPNIDSESIPRVHAMMDQWPDPMLWHDGAPPLPRQARTPWKQELAACEHALRNSGRRYVAVGEIGFDLHWDKTTQYGSNTLHSNVKWHGPKSSSLPVVIHVREAFDAMFEALDHLNDDRVTGSRALLHRDTGTGKRVSWPTVIFTSALAALLLTRTADWMLCCLTFPTTALSWKPIALISRPFRTEENATNRPTPQSLRNA